MFQLDKKHQKYQKYNPTNIDWIGDIPDGWEVKKLKNSFSFEKWKNAWLYTQEYISSDENKWEYPVYSGQTGNNGVMGYINTFIYDEERAIFTTTVWAKVMTPMLLSGKFSLSQNCVLFKRTNVVDEWYFYYQLFPLFQRKIDDIPSHMQPSLRIGDLNKYLVIYPSLEEQQKITNYLDEKMALLDEAIAKKQKQIELLAEHRTALINDAITKGLNSDVEMKDSGIDWVGMIPKGWEVKKMKFIGKSITGLTYSPDEVSDNGILVLRSSNIQKWLLDYNDTVYVNRDIPSDLIIQDGDILICSRNGSKALIWKNVRLCNLSKNTTFGAFMTVFRTKNSRFISYVLRSNIFASQIETFLTATINQLTLGNLNSLVVPIPSNLEEQGDIADYLDKETKYINDMIAKIEKSIELLEEYKTSLISHTVSGKIKVS